MADEIVRAMTADGYVKAVAVTGRDLVERARNIHTLLPMATAALGRALLGASMMGDMLKEQKGSLTLQIKGGGPLGTVLAVSDYEGNVRGYVQDPHVELMEKVPGKLDVGAAVGTDGSLTVIKDLGLRNPISALSACSPGRSPTTSPCTLWKASRSPPPAPWEFWWTGTRASWPPAAI